MKGHAQKLAASYGVGGKVQAPVVGTIGVRSPVGVYVHSGMKEDRFSNPLRRKCSRLELNIHGLHVGTEILLGVGRNHGGAEKDTSRGHSRWKHILHGQWFESTEYSLLGQEKTSVGGHSGSMVKNSRILPVICHTDAFTLGTLHGIRSLEGRVPGGMR
jgi:hypothetical protein